MTLLLTAGSLLAIILALVALTVWRIAVALRQAAADDDAYPYSEHPADWPRVVRAIDEPMTLVGSIIIAIGAVAIAAARTGVSS